MKLRIVIISLFVSFHGISQDTLIDQNGQLLPVKAFYLNKEKDILGYVKDRDTLFQSTKSLSSYIIHSEVSNDNGIFPMNSKRLEDSDYYSQEIREIGPSKRPLPYQFSKFSVGFNAFSLLSKGRRVGYNNMNIHFFSEYRPNEKFALKVPLRIGINPIAPGEKFEYLNTYRFVDVLWELGVEPKYYSNGDRMLSLVFYPGVHLGSSRTFNHYRYETMKVDLTYQADSSFYMSTNNQFFVRYSINSGLHYNFSRFLQTGLDLSISLFGTSVHNNYYYYYKQDPQNNYLLKGTDNQRYKPVFLSFSFYIIHRFGAKKR